MQKKGIAPEIRSRRVPDWFRIPDVVFTTPVTKWKRTGKAETFLVETSKLSSFLQLFAQSKFSRDSQKKTLILCNSDKKLTELKPSLVADALEQFSKVFISGFDKYEFGFEVYPVGFTEHYIRGQEHQIITLFNKPEVDDRPILALAEWGARWNGLSESIQSRADATNWAQSNGHFVKFGQSAFLEHISNLANSRYSICPPGHGIQSPKTFEAWFFGAIPIVERCVTFERLAQRGFPYLLVDRWDDITEELLENNYNKLKREVDELRTDISSPRRFFQRCFAD